MVNTADGLGDGPKDAGQIRSRWRNRSEPLMLPQHPAQLIAYSRLALAAFALVAVYLDPTQPTRFSGVAYFLLAAYTIYALTMAIASHVASVGPRWSVVLHALELAVLAVLLYLTDGPTSPFFVFFTFAIISAALRWGATGTVVTSAVLLAFFLAVSLGQSGVSDDTDLNRVIMRAAYLLVAAVLLGYFGAYRHRSRDRLERLAAWPQPEHDDHGAPVTASALAHAAATLGAHGILVIWADGDSGLRTVHWSEGALVRSQLNDPNGDPVVAELLGHRSFMGANAHEKTAIMAAGRLQVGASLLDAEFSERYNIGSFSTAPFQTVHSHGRVFVLGPDALTSELLPLTEIVASRIGFEFEQFWLRSDIAVSAATQERTRLARDMHDSILQDLTAAGLRLKIMSDRAPPEVQPAYAGMLTLIAAHQRRVREFVTIANPKPDTRVKAPIAGVLEHVAAELSRQWRCRIVWDVQPEDTGLHQAQMLQLQLLLAEAVANAARHGQATEIEISVELEDSLMILVRDNGIARVHRSKDGTSVLSPFSLTQRVEELGGTCHLSVNEGGSLLSLALPRE